MVRSQSPAKNPPFVSSKGTSFSQGPSEMQFFSCSHFYRSHRDSHFECTLTQKFAGILLKWHLPHCRLSEQMVLSVNSFFCLFAKFPFLSLSLVRRILFLPVFLQCNVGHDGCRTSSLLLLGTRSTFVLRKPLRAMNWDCHTAREGPAVNSS